MNSEYDFEIRLESDKSDSHKIIGMKIAGNSCYEVKLLFVKKCAFYKELKNI